MIFNSGGAGDPGPERPSRGKKIRKQLSLTQLVIFVILFVVLFFLMLAGITIVEMAAKASREAELQKQQAAEDFCLTNGLNRTYAELDNCIEVSLMLSEAGVPPRGTTARIIIEAGIPAETVRKMVENGAFGQ